MEKENEFKDVSVCIGKLTNFKGGGCVEVYSSSENGFLKLVIDERLVKNGSIIIVKSDE